jgi:RNA polymerase sigma-70 factor (ECF subfamily)
VNDDPTGSEQQFERFYREHYTEVRRFARTLVCADDVDDIVSASFTTAWQKFEQIPTESARAWLFGTARNMARNRWAMGRRAAALADVIELARPNLTARLADGGFDPVEVAPLLDVLRSLTDTDRELLIMAGWFEMTPNEIAAVTGDRTGNVRVRLHRLRKRLGRDFRQRIDGGEVA